MKVTFPIYFLYYPIPKIPVILDFFFIEKFEKSAILSKQNYVQCGPKWKKILHFSMIYGYGRCHAKLETRLKFKQDVKWIARFLAHLNFPRMHNSKQVNPTTKIVICKI